MRIHRHRWIPLDHKGQWRGALMFFFICAWTNIGGNKRYNGDLRRHRANYDVTVMIVTQGYQIIMPHSILHPCLCWFTIFTLNEYCLDQNLSFSLMSWSYFLYSGIRKLMAGSIIPYCSVPVTPWRPVIVPEASRQRQQLEPELRCYSQVSMMTSSHGRAFLITGPLWGESTGHRWIPLTKDQWCGSLVFLWCQSQQAVEQAVERQAN